MTAEIYNFDGDTTVPHSPDDVLERAKGEDFDVAIVLGYRAGGALDVRSSTSNLERVVFMLELAKQMVIDLVRMNEKDGAV